MVAISAMRVTGEFGTVSSVVSGVFGLMLGAAGLAGRFMTSPTVLILSAGERREHVVGDVALGDAHPRGALAIDVDLDRRKVQHLGDAGIDHARNLLDGVHDALRRRIR